MSKFEMYTTRILALCAVFFGAAVFAGAVPAAVLIGRAPLIPTLVCLAGYILLSGAVFLAGSKASAGTLRLICGFSTAALFVFCLCYVIVSPLSPDADLSHIIKQSREMIMQGTHIFTNRDYFSLYPHNIPCAIIVYWIFRLSCLVSGSMAYTGAFAGVCNVLFIFASIVMLYKTVDCLTVNRQAAFPMKMLLLCNPAWAAFAGYYYTDTLSLPFLTGGFLAFCKAMKREGGKRYAGFVLSGFLFSVAIRIRVTAAILMIAIIAALIIRKKWKPALTFLAAFLCMFGAVQCLYTGIYHYHIDFETYDTAAPPMHYVMMGSHGKGSYDQDDVNFTKSFPTHEEKVRQTAQRTLQNLRDNGVHGCLLQIAKKVGVMFCEGTTGYYQFCRYTEAASRIHDRIAGDKSGFFKGIMQSYRMIWALLFALGAAACRKKSGLPELIILIYFSGVVMFTAIWELHPRHAVTYIPLLSLLTVPFLEKISIRCKKTGQGR